jgi:hypothetical protein
MYGTWIIWPILLILLVWWLSLSWRYRWRGGYGAASPWIYGAGPISQYQGSQGFWRRRAGVHGGKGPVGYHRSDERVAEDVNDALLVNDELDAVGISVSVQNGIVTLSGSVPSRSDKHLAAALADSVAGVIDVKNELRIGIAPPDETRQTKSIGPGPG